MKRAFAICLGLFLLSGPLTGCASKTQPAKESISPAIESESLAESSSSIDPVDITEETSEPEEPPEQSEGFLADIHEYSALLDKSFADLYANDPESKLYFSYNNGAYTKNALLDYSIITEEYKDINEWFFTEGEMTGPDPGMADKYYDFENGKYKMEDFPIKTFYISGENLAGLYGEKITKEDMEEILGVNFVLVQNEMTGTSMSPPLEIEKYIVEIHFSPESLVYSIGLSEG